MSANRQSLNRIPEESPNTGFRYYDSQERLVAWSVRVGDQIIFYQVKSWEEIMTPEGMVTVPAEIVCTYTDRELDPNHAPEHCDSSDNSWFEGGEWTGRECDTNVDLQYNRARCFDGAQGRWLSDAPLSFEPSGSDVFPYVKNS